jgi:nucleoside-diphosphate-sugar epimerase
MSDRVISILGCGWLGKALGRVLVNSGYQVIGSTTKRENIGGLEALGIMPTVFDVSDLFSGNFNHSFFNSDVLVISLPHGIRRGKAEEYINQISGVIQAAKGGKTKHMLLISTTSVYNNLNRIVTEQDADPQNPIVQAEASVMQSGIPSTVLRLAGLYGPGRDAGRFLANMREVAGGNVPVNLIHLDDCIEIITSIIKHQLWNKILNACADEHPTKKEFYTKAAIAAGVEPPTFSEERKDYKIVSNELLKHTLNYKFIHRVI